MENPQFHVSPQTEDLQTGHENQDWEKSPWTKDVSKARTSRRRSPRMTPEEKPSRADRQSTIALICGWVVKHQLGIALNLLCILLLLHTAVPSSRDYTRKLMHLSYYNKDSGRYALGPDDSLFLSFWIVFLTGLRAGVIDYLLIPLAARAGIEKKKAKVRFAEQAWILCHHGTSWFCGLYIWYNSSYWLNLRALWWDFPAREMDGFSKYYYLVALSFWLQQLVVVNIEERRKDHLQMFTHHMITCALIFASYCYHQTKVGNVILCLMDGVDLLLPLAKILKYLKFRLVCDIAFGAFMITWFVARHIFYMAVCWSVYAHLPVETNYGCYRGTAAQLEGPLPVPNDWYHLLHPFINPVGLVCFNDGIMKVFLGVLLGLQGILLIWLSMIVKVAFKVLSGEGADDTRSDDEDSEADGEEEAEASLDRIRLCVEPRPFALPPSNLPIEMEVGYDEMHISPSRRGRASPARRSLRKSEGHAAATTTAVSLRGPSNRKELLGRIGCDKGS